MSVYLYSATITANGNYPVGNATARKLDNNLARPDQGQKRTLSVSGTFGAGTVKLVAGYVHVDGSTVEYDIPGASFTVPGTVTFEVYADSLKLVLTGATAPSIKVNIR